jgi:hypothetical protein
MNPHSYIHHIFIWGSVQTMYTHVANVKTKKKKKERKKQSYLNASL